MRNFLQILGGYVFDAFLTPWTLLIKALGLALAVASGLSLGKEVNDFSYSSVIPVLDVHARDPLSMWHVACHTYFPKISSNSETMKVLMHSQPLHNPLIFLLKLKKESFWQQQQPLECL